MDEALVLKAKADLTKALEPLQALLKTMKEVGTEAVAMGKSIANTGKSSGGGGGRKKTIKDVIGISADDLKKEFSVMQFEFDRLNKQMKVAEQGVYNERVQELHKFSAEVMRTENEVASFKKKLSEKSVADELKLQQEKFKKMGLKSVKISPIQYPTSSLKEHQKEEERRLADEIKTAERMLKERNAVYKDASKQLEAVAKQMEKDKIRMSTPINMKSVLGDGFTKSFSGKFNIETYASANKSLSSSLKEHQREAEKAAKAQEKLGQATDNTGKSFNQAASHLLKFVSISSVLATSIKVIGDSLKKGFDYNLIVESSDLMFGALVKDTALGKKAVKDLIEVTMQMPVTIKEATDSARQLLAYGFNVNSLVTNMKMLGDVTAATGGRIDDLAYVYGTLRSQGRAYSRDLMQFAMRGIPIYDELAKVLGVSAKDIKKLTEEGKIGFEEVEQAFRNMTSAGGVYFEANATKLKSLSGQVELLSKKFERLMGLITESSMGMTSSIVNGVSTMIDGISQAVKTFTAMADTIEGQLIRVMVAMGVGASAGMLFGPAGAAVGAMAGLASQAVTLKPLPVAEEALNKDLSEKLQMNIDDVIKEVSIFSDALKMNTKSVSKIISDLVNSPKITGSFDNIVTYADKAGIKLDEMAGILDKFGLATQDTIISLRAAQNITRNSADKSTTHTKIPTSSALSAAGFNMSTVLEKATSSIANARFYADISKNLAPSLPMITAQVAGELSNQLRSDKGKTFATQPNLKRIADTFTPETGMLTAANTYKNLASTSSGTNKEFYQKMYDETIESFNDSIKIAIESLVQSISGGTLDKEYEKLIPMLLAKLVPTIGGKSTKPVEEKPTDFLRRLQASTSFTQIDDLKLEFEDKLAQLNKEYGEWIDTAKKAGKSTTDIEATQKDAQELLKANKDRIITAQTKAETVQGTMPDVITAQIAAVRGGYEADIKSQQALFNYNKKLAEAEFGKRLFKDNKELEQAEKLFKKEQELLKAQHDYKMETIRENALYEKKMMGADIQDMGASLLKLQGADAVANIVMLDAELKRINANRERDIANANLDQKLVNQYYDLKEELAIGNAKEERKRILKDAKTKFTNDTMGGNTEAFDELRYKAMTSLTGSSVNDLGQTITGSKINVPAGIGQYATSQMGGTNLGQLLTGSFNPLVSIVTTLVQEFLKLENVMKIVNFVGTMVSAMFENIGVNLNRVLEPFVNILEYIGQAVGELAQVFIAIASIIGNIIYSALLPFQVLLKVFVELFAFVSDGILSVANGFIDAINGVIRMVNKALPLGTPIKELTKLETSADRLSRMFDETADKMKAQKQMDKLGNTVSYLNDVLREKLGVERNALQELYNVGAISATEFDTGMKALSLYEKDYSKEMFEVSDGTYQEIHAQKAFLEGIDKTLKNNDGLKIDDSAIQSGLNSVTSAMTSGAPVVSALALGIEKLPAGFAEGMTAYMSAIPKEILLGTSTLDSAISNLSGSVASLASSILSGSSNALPDVLPDVLPKDDFGDFWVKNPLQSSNLALPTNMVRTDTIPTVHTGNSNPLQSNFTLPTGMRPISSFAVGTPYVPNDMLSQIHKGEIIIPRDFSDGLRNGDLQLSSKGSGGSGGDVYVSVHVEGSVQAEDDLAKTITNAIYRTRRSGALV